MMASVSAGFASCHLNLSTKEGGVEVYSFHSSRLKCAIAIVAPNCVSAVSWIGFLAIHRR